MDVSVAQDRQGLKRRQGIGEIRSVHLHKHPDEGLGMSITVGMSQLVF